MDWLRGAGVSGALAVALGAFGAHVLRGKVDASALKTWETAATYHLVHAAALGVCGAARVSGAAGWLFASGTLLFSGSLYAMVRRLSKLLIIRTTPHSDIALSTVTRMQAHAYPHTQTRRS